MIKKLEINSLSVDLLIFIGYLQYRIFITCKTVCPESQFQGLKKKKKKKHLKK